MELTITRHLAIGNGILTVENSDQAWVRADMDKRQGWDVRAALEMASLKHQMLAGNRGGNA